MFRPLLTATFALLVSSLPARADDTEKAMAKIATLGPGVHAIKTDKKGRIVSCVVVGQARISTVLGKSKGLQVARDKARLDASAQYAKWLNEHVSVFESSEDETILFLEGNEENDKAAMKEAGKSVEKQSKKMQSISQGLVRGLQVLHAQQTGDDKTYTIVMGWDAKTAAKIKGIAETDDAKPDDEPAKKPKSKKPDQIEDKSVTSPDAKKFLP